MTKHIGKIFIGLLVSASWVTIYNNIDMDDGCSIEEPRCKKSRWSEYNEERRDRYREKKSKYRD